MVIDIGLGNFGNFEAYYQAQSTYKRLRGKPDVAERYLKKIDAETIPEIICYIFSPSWIGKVRGAERVVKEDLERKAKEDLR